MPLCSPIYDPGEAFTGRATGAAVTGCRLVTPAATKADGQPTPIRHCAATEQPIGVAAADAAIDDVTAIYPPGIVLPVEVGGTGATAGTRAEVIAGGMVQNLGTGIKVGVFLTTTAAAGFALVQLQF